MQGADEERERDVGRVIRQPDLGLVGHKEGRQGIGTVLAKWAVSLCGYLLWCTVFLKKQVTGKSVIHNAISIYTNT